MIARAGHSAFPTDEETDEEKDALLLAFEAGRRAGLEEAAKACDRAGVPLGRAIRALKD